jgi:uncharacterized RDD family membrane protein YckC
MNRVNQPSDPAEAAGNQPEQPAWQQAAGQQAAGQQAADRQGPESGPSAGPPPQPWMPQETQPGYGPPASQGYPGYGAPPGQQPDPGYSTPPGQAYPGYSAPPGQQPDPGYSTPPGHANPGYSAPPSQQPGYSTPPSQAHPGYGTPPGQPDPGYSAPPSQQPGYSTPPSQAHPGYGTPPGQPDPGYGTPPGQQPNPAYGTPPGQAYPGYGAPPGQQPNPGYGTPPGQAYPGYGNPGQAYPGYPAPGQGYPAYPQQAGYGRYPAYGGGKDPALAEWWRRLLARLIDWIVLGVVFAPLWYPPWRTFLRTVSNISNRYPGRNINAIPAARTQLAHAESHLLGRLVVVFLLYYLVAFFYDWVQHAAWGQTLGKRALGTQVVMADGRGTVGAGPAGARAAIYALPPIVPFVGSLFSLVNELWLTWDPRRQCLHDKAAHTVVIKKNYLGSPPTQASGWQ